MNPTIAIARHRWQSLGQGAVAACVILWLVALCCLPIPLWGGARPFIRWGSVVALAIVWWTVHPAPLITRQHWPALWFAVAALPSVLLALEPDLAWSGRLHGVLQEWIGGYRDLVLAGMAWFVIAAHVFQRPAWQRRLGVWLLCSMVLVVAIGYLEILARQNVIYERWVANPVFYQRFIRQQRMMSTQLHPVILGSLLTVCLPLALHHAMMASRSAARLAWDAVTLLLACAIIQTFTRGSLLAMMVGVSAYLLAMKRRAWLRITAIAVVIVILGASYLARHRHPSEQGSVGAARYSVTALHDIVQGRAANWRWDNAALALEHVRQQPLFGIGFNHYRHLFTRYRPATRLSRELHITDNVYLKILAETGLVGTLGFAWLLWSGLRCWREGLARAPTLTDRSRLAAFGAGWLALLASMATYDGLWWLLPLAIFWIWLGILHAPTVAPPAAAP